MGAQGTYYAKPRGDHLDRVHSDQKVLYFLRQGRLVLVIRGQESQASLRDHQARVHSDQMVFMIARREAGPPKELKRLHFLKLKLKKFKTFR